MRNLDHKESPNIPSNSTSISRRDSYPKKSSKKQKPKENKKTLTFSYFNEKEKKISDTSPDIPTITKFSDKQKITRTCRAQGGEKKPQKNSKINCRNKIKKIKKRTQKRDSNLYDINNFVVQNNSNKINEKKDYINIPIPVFKELEEDYYEIKAEMPLDLELNETMGNNVTFYLTENIFFLFFVRMRMSYI